MCVQPSHTYLCCDVLIGRVCPPSVLTSDQTDTNSLLFCMKALSPDVRLLHVQ